MMPHQPYMLTIDSIDLSTITYPMIGNNEFIVLYIAKHGPTTWKILREALLEWRGIQNASRGHFAKYFAVDGMYHSGYSGSTYDDARHFWWRPLGPDLGKVYNLTRVGEEKLSLILATLEERRKGFHDGKN